MQSAPESTAGPRPGSRARWLFVLGILVAGLAAGGLAGYLYAQKSLKAAPRVVIAAEQIAAQDAAVRQSQAESRFLRAQLDTADGEIAVERAARQELEVQLRASQDELGRVRDRLAFFEQLLPPGPEGAVDIRGAEVQRDGQVLKYRVLLMRSGRSDAPFVGALRFQATGILKGEVVSVDLAPMQIKSDTPEGDDDGSAKSNDSAKGGNNAKASDSAKGGDSAKASDTSKGNGNAKGSANSKSNTASGAAAAADDRLAVQFDQYQRSEGVLELPEGFLPDTVVISVLEGSTVRASRTIKLAF